MFHKSMTARTTIVPVVLSNQAGDTKLQPSERDAFFTLGSEIDALTSLRTVSLDLQMSHPPGPKPQHANQSDYGEFMRSRIQNLLFTSLRFSTVSPGPLLSSMRVTAMIWLQRHKSDARIISHKLPNQVGT